LPYGRIRTMDAECPTLTYNLIGRHQSRYVNTRVASVKSPWLLKCEVGIYTQFPYRTERGGLSPHPICLRARGSRADRFPVCRRKRKPLNGHSLKPERLNVAIEGITSPTGVARKDGSSERAGIMSQRISTATSSSPCLRAE
jgi:phosphoribosylformylglycinamidine synthase